MTITQEKIDSLRSKVKVNLKKEDYEPQVKKQLKSLSKVVQIKGFRPGMVPTDLVKKMYGNGVLAEELNKILNDEVYKYINDNKIDIIASPIPAEGQKLDIDIYGLRDIDFDYEIGHAPDVSLSYLDKAPTFTKYSIKADDKMIDEEVDRIRKRFATYEYPETVGDNDILTFTIEELDKEGNLKPGGVSTVSSIMVDLLKDTYKTQVLALKKQESFEADVFDLMDRDRESMAKNVLNMNDLAKLSEVGNRFRLTLNNITRSVPAVVNEEFFQKVYGDNGPKTEAEMRANIKADLEAYFDGQTDSYVVNDLYKGIMENVEFPLPDDFLKRWIDLTNEKPISQEEIERDYPQFAKSLRWSLIQKKIKEQENLDVTEDEIRERVRTNVIHQLYGYGLKNIGEEWVEQFMQKQLADKKVLSQTRDQILEDKVLNYVKSKATLVEKEVSLDEFKALMEKV
ncbi:MAG: trigger factor [Chitinophagales bacterium]|nr:trigger factor [Chitinophagales bacterium]